MIKQIVQSHWDYVRWLRLLIGIGFLIGSIISRDGLTALVGGFFLFQAVFNISCCGASGCATGTSKNQSNEIEEIEFEEIKSK
ncbi:MAG: hypothetical protein H0X62_07370 [Bacteroidetes bacterium]|nr:hypothetical protein [Bacteroidota bacterium]